MSVDFSCVPDAAFNITQMKLKLLEKIAAANLKFEVEAISASETSPLIGN